GATIYSGGCYSVAMTGGKVYCSYSVAMICGTACGLRSIAIGYDNIVYSNCAAVIGGGCNDCGNVLCCGNDNSVILGGYGIIVNPNCLPNTVIIPNLAIYCTPVGSGNILCWNSTTKLVGITTGGTSGDLNNYYNKIQINSYTGTTVPANYYNKIQINSYTGTTVPANYYNKIQINSYTGTTVPANYYNKI